MSQHLTPNTPEWNAMWASLENACGDTADKCPQTGEVWQYMGTYDGRHQFRHRHRPDTARPIDGFAGKHVDRVYLHLDADSLVVTRVHVKLYLDEQPTQKQPTLRQEYSGAFDGIQVVSDADPGL